jgi:hypothetical protein
MWARDPFKAKWTVLAHAYSAICDRVGEAVAPLDQFLTIVTPEIGIIGTEDYMALMGWELIMEDDALELKQVFVPDVSTLNWRFRTSGMTEKDVVHFCAAQGYITRALAHAIAGVPRYVTVLGAAAVQRAVRFALPNNGGGPASAALTNGVIPNSFLVNNLDDLEATSSEVFSFDVNEILGDVMDEFDMALEFGDAAEDEVAPPPPTPAATPPPPHEWTGCMADVYNAGEGFFDFQYVRE